MAEITKDIFPDVARKNNFRVILAKQFDENSRYLRAEINNDGRRINIGKNCSVVFNVKRADGKMRAILGSVNADGTVRVPLTEWLLSVVGTAVCSISIIEGEENKLTTMSFEVQVEQQEYIENGDITEDENYDILVDLIAEVTELKNDTTEATDSANKATELANSAADAANSAAKAAREVAEGLENAAERAETATENANNAAKSASDNAQKAETSARNADSAAERANTAAGEIEGAVANASEALKQATDAAKNAEQATTDAQAAVSAANEAIEKADTSSAAAEKAAENANNAANKALDAVTSIESSVEKAEQAVKDAETATTTATEAAANAEKAIEAANTAKAEADAATKTANDAAGVATAAAGAATSAARNANDAATSANQAIEELSGAAQEATEAATNASSAADSATTAAGLANSAAEKCESAATSATNAATSANQAAERVETAITGANEAATSATKAGETATQAAESCNTAAAKAEGAAEQCNTATEGANSAASAANSAATKADTAAENAEKATAEANKWANVTTVAKTLDAGAEATATLTETEDGKQFEFGIPKGEKGDTGLQGTQGINLLKGTKEYIEIPNTVPKFNYGKSELNSTYNNFNVRYCNFTQDTSTIFSEWTSIYPNKYGEYYTFSFFAKGSGVCTLFFYGDSGAVRAIGEKDLSSLNLTKVEGNSAGAFVINLTSDWEQYYATWKLDDIGDLKTQKRLLIRKDPGDPAELYLCAPKLEIGPITSPVWTPSPEDIEAEIKEVENKVDDISIGGRNLLFDTKKISKNLWRNLGQWNKEQETYLGLNVVSRSARWGGLSQNINLIGGKYYTYSFYIKSEKEYTFQVSNDINLSSMSISPAYSNVKSSTKWERKSITFIAQSDGVSNIKVEYNADENLKYYICGLKLEIGEISTDWSPAPEDLETTADNFAGVLPLSKGGTGFTSLQELANALKPYLSGVSADEPAEMPELSESPIIEQTETQESAGDEMESEHNNTDDLRQERTETDEQEEQE